MLGVSAESVGVLWRDILLYTANLITPEEIGENHPLYTDLRDGLVAWQKKAPLINGCVVLRSIRGAFWVIFS
jgi:hypothetical protein